MAENAAALATASRPYPPHIVTRKEDQGDEVKVASAFL
ncbi:hypothetical protein Aug2020_02620 [Sphingomonas aquatilis]|nr:hypothetical protein Aug2020_02620 [Sphingomonas aquatilis]